VPKSNREIKQEVKVQKEIMKEAKATVQAFFKDEHDVKIARTAVNDFVKASNKVSKLTEKLETQHGSKEES